MVIKILEPPLRLWPSHFEVDGCYFVSGCPGSSRTSPALRRRKVAQARHLLFLAIVLKTLSIFPIHNFLFLIFVGLKFSILCDNLKSLFIPSLIRLTWTEPRTQCLSQPNRPVALLDLVPVQEKSRPINPGTGAYWCIQRCTGVTSWVTFID